MFLLQLHDQEERAIRTINRARADGTLTEQVAAAAIEQTKLRYQELGDAGVQAFSRLEETAGTVGQAVNAAFERFLFDPFKEGLKGLLLAFLDTIRQIVAAQAAAGSRRSSRRRSRASAPAAGEAVGAEASPRAA